MQELIDKLKAEAGLTDEQAKKAIEAIKNYVVDKFPIWRKLILYQRLPDRSAFTSAGTIGCFIRSEATGTTFKHYYQYE